MSAAMELTRTFDCFGSSCEVRLGAPARAQEALRAVELVQRKLEGWHARFSRFLPGSELCRLNGNPSRTVPVSPLMARLAQAVALAGSSSGGLVDGTLIDQIEAAGYVRDLRHPLPLAMALALAPGRRPARAASDAGWRHLEVDVRAGTVTRPPGVKLDSGGLAKGLFADALAEMLASQPSFAIDCAGDLAVGGRAARPRAINVESPFDASTLHTFHLSRTAVATSGIGRRSWLDRDGRPAHHLLDPATGRPAFTGIVQATALAPSALMAEIYAKAALLSGPSAAEGWLARGGLLVFDDGSHRVIEPPRRESHLSRRPAARLRLAAPPADSRALAPRRSSDRASVRVRVGSHPPASSTATRSAPRAGGTA
jgi:thiamine biosynthesis lipoprotein